MKIYLHIGLFKTASTYLQYQLVENYHNLLKDNVLYIHEFYHFFRNMANMMPLGSAMASNFKEWTHKLHKCPRETIILSCESLCYLQDPYQMAEQLLYIFDGFDVEIILIVKRQDTFIESMYAQAVKTGEKESFQKNYSRLNFDTLDWYNLAKSHEWPIHVLPFEIVKDKRLAGEFLKIFSNVEPVEDKIVNPTPNKRGLEIIRFHNIHGTLTEDKKREIISNHPKDGLLNLLGDNQRKVLLEYHRDNNIKLFNEYIHTGLEYMEYYKKAPH